MKSVRFLTPSATNGRAGGMRKFPARRDGCTAVRYKDIVKKAKIFYFIYIHKPPISITFGPTTHTPAPPVKPLQFSAAYPVAYKWSY